MICYDKYTKENVLATFYLGVEQGNIEWLLILRSWLNKKDRDFNCEICNFDLSNCECNYCKNCDYKFCKCEYLLLENKLKKSEFRNLIRVEIWNLAKFYLNKNQLKEITNQISNLNKNLIFFFPYEKIEWEYLDSISNTEV